MLAQKVAQMFLKNAQKVATTVFLKIVIFYKIAQKVANLLGYFRSKFC